MLLVGAAGWGLLGIASWTGEFDGAVAAPAGPLWFALFLGVIVGARALAFELLPGTFVSADAAFYVAAAVCMGPLGAGWLVAMALTVDSVLRLRRVGRAQAKASRGRVRSLAYVLYFGAMTGALLAGVAWLFGAAGGIDASSHAGLFGVVFALGTTFLVVHYAIQGLRQFLAGRPLRVYLRQLALPTMLAELSLMPLAVVAALVYDPHEPVGFALLAATFLVVNVILNRLGRARDKLQHRVNELETLNATARGLSRSLESEQLVTSVGREIAGAVPSGRWLRATLYDTSSGGFRQLEYNCSADRLSTRSLSTIDSATGQVLESGRPLSTTGWLGVPIVMYGGIEGVLSIEAESQQRFGDNQQRLLESVSGQLAVALQNAHLYELAMVDGLTGLFVRRYFDARLDEEIKRADRFGTVFSVVMIDVDNFKVLNDRHGHVVGDRALRAISEVVRGQMRGVDTAARYGGEEIALILPRTEMLDAYNQAERIRDKIAGLELGPTEAGDALHATASFGIAAYPDCGASTGEDLVRCADRALYRAKKTGKNRVELYWTDDGEPAGKSSIRTV